MTTAIKPLSPEALKEWRTFESRVQQLILEQNPEFRARLEVTLTSHATPTRPDLPRPPDPTRRTGPYRSDIPALTTPTSRTRPSPPAPTIPSDPARRSQPIHPHPHPPTPRELAGLIDRGVISRRQALALLGLEDDQSRIPMASWFDSMKVRTSWYPPYGVSRAGWGTVWRWGAFIGGPLLLGGLSGRPRGAVVAIIILGLALGAWRGTWRRPTTLGGTYRVAAAGLAILGIYALPFAYPLLPVLAVAGIVALAVDAGWSTLKADQ